MAVAATRDRDEALDLVQDSMLRLAQSYAARPEDEWPPLFYRILQRRILDWHRRGRVRRLLFATPTPEQPPPEAVEDSARSPDETLAGERTLDRLQQALAHLPRRQQQVFLLREMEGFDVEQTATIMQCSPGSVKTHLHRARQALRRALGDLVE